MFVSQQQNWHIEPPYGLLNDPNGLVWHNGTYHVFFQWNRFAKDHSSKAWGWCVSPDLVHWRFRGSALLPDQPYDAQGVYSGCAMVLDDKLHLFYTGNVKQNGERISHQCLAVSEDGRHFQKRGPFLPPPTGCTGHVRDPKVVARAAGGYLMVLGAQLDSGVGAVLRYDSPDGLHWTPRGTLGVSQEYQMIECPELFETDGTSVLLYCPQHRDNQSDASLDSFSAYKLLEGDPMQQQTDLDHGWQRLDDGFDFYAPQTFLTPDGRRVLLAWMSRMEGEEETAFAAHAPRIHCLTMPRELFLQNGRLCQRPIRELRQLAATPLAAQADGEERRWALPSRAFRLTLTSETPCGDLELTLHGGEWRFTYHAATGCAAVYRRRWIDGGEDVRTVTLTALTALALWCDQSSAELFLNDGAATFSARIYPAAAHASLHAAGISQGISAQLVLLPEKLYNPIDNEEEKS